MTLDFATSSSGSARAQLHGEVTRNRIVAISACVLVLILACGGDEELTEQEYFMQLEGISDAANAKFQPVVDRLNVEYESETEAIRVRREFFEADLRILGEMEEDLEGLLPPESVRSAHREYTAALAHLQDVIARLTRRLGEALSLVEIEELFADAELQAATDRFDEACLELETLASRSNIDANLDCESSGAVQISR